MKKYIILLLISAFIICKLYFQLIKTKNEIINIENFEKVLNDSIKFYKNKNNENVAKIKVFETEKLKDFIKIKTKDSVVTELQKQLRKNKKFLKKQGSITKFSTITKVKIVEKTIVKNNNYTSQFNLNNWVYGNSFASKDSTVLNFKIKNEYLVLIGREKKGWFKSQPFAEITNKNPYSEIKTLRVYQLSLPRKKRFSFGPIISYRLNTNSFFFGLGIQYTILRF